MIGTVRRILDYSRSYVFQSILLTKRRGQRKLALPFLRLLPLNILDHNIFPCPLVLVRNLGGERVNKGSAGLDTQSGEGMSFRLHPFGFLRCERIV